MTLFYVLQVLLDFHTSQVFPLISSFFIAILHGLNVYRATYGQQHHGFWSRILVTWMNPTMVNGYNDNLDINTLPSLPNFQKSGQNAHQLHRKLFEKKVKKDGKALYESVSTQKKTLFKALVELYAGSILEAAFFSTCWAVLTTFAFPKLFAMLMDFVEDESMSNQHGLAIGVLFLMVRLSAELLAVHGFWANILNVNRQFSGSVKGAIYRKAISLSNKARNKYTVGEMVNLSGTDVGELSGVLISSEFLFNGQVIFYVASYMLYQELGVASFAGTGILLCVIPFSMLYNKVEKKLSKTRMDFKDDRVNKSNEVLSGIKIMKLYSWENPFLERISDIRKNEIKTMKKTSVYRALNGLMWEVAPLMVTIVSFVTYAALDNSEPLTVKKIFVCLMLFGLLRSPCGGLPWVIGTVIRAKVSYNRIQDFLMCEELPSIDTSKKDVQCKMQGATFEWEKVSEDEGTFQLSSIDFEAHRGQLVAVIGSVGSGKSSLLQAILKNMPQTGGFYSQSGKISYVPQEAWIQNTTVRDNVCFGEKFIKRDYEKILKVTSLEGDVAQLEKGDRTKIGEKGITLSGGQKQRLSIAKALYTSRKEKERTLYMFDDPLSALDMHVGRHVFDKCISDDGYLRGCTRILVTNSLSVLPKCSMIYVLENGKVAEKGTHQELSAKGGLFAKMVRENRSAKSHWQTLRASVVKAKPVTSRIKRRLSRRQSTKSFYSSTTDTGSCAELDDFEEQIDYDDPDEEEHGHVKMAVFMNYFRAVGPKICIAIVIFFCLRHGLNAYSNVWLSQWDQTNRTTNEQLTIYGLLGLAQTIMMMLSTIFVAYAAFTASQYYHDILLEKVLYAPLSFFNKTPTGTILNRVGNDINKIDNSVPEAVRSVVEILIRESIYFRLISNNNFSPGISDDNHSLFNPMVLACVSATVCSLLLYTASICTNVSTITTN